MKQEVTWGTAAALAIVAAVGIFSQSGSKPSGAASGSDRAGAIATKKAKAPPKGVPGEVEPQCADSIPLIKHFFLDAEVVGPESCYAEGHRPPAAPLEAAQPDSIIASFPDPLHTHFSLLFDRFIEALQQGLQDEGYQYDSSWLPWETEESFFALLPDQDEVEDRKGKREDQPGILLFRGPGDAP